MKSDEAKELLRRLEALEAENARLKQNRDQSAPQPLVVRETDYNGHPVLEFQRGNKKPFRIGLKKLEAVQEGWEQVTAFLSRHQKIDSSDQKIDPNENDLQI
ncbi:MAG: hypothetical protein ABF384_10200 [Verrucomicrobiales bacterium]